MSITIPFSQSILILLLLIFLGGSFVSGFSPIALSKTGSTSISASVLAPERKPLEKEWLMEDDEDEEEDEYLDDLVDGLAQELGEMEGLWYSDDFYGKHGREWVQISTRLVGASATRAMVATKVTGDAHVPAGCVTWQTNAWPMEGGAGVQAEIQVRANPDDPDGFSWLPGELTLVHKKQIRLACHYTPTMKNIGTFYKHDEEETADDAWN